MVHIQAVGGPTAILEVGGLRLLTDPTFDPPGDYPRPDGPTLVKLAPPALGPDDLGRVDAVLLSHDQHADNLDRSGRAYLARVPVTLTTPSGSARLTREWAAAGPAGNGRLNQTGSPGRRDWRPGTRLTWRVRMAAPSGSPPFPPGTGLRGANRSAAR